MARGHCTFVEPNGTDRGLAGLSNYRQKEETRFSYSRLLSATYRPVFLGLCRASDVGQGC
jgi:hypothetical protein